MSPTSSSATAIPTSASAPTCKAMCKWRSGRRGCRRASSSMAMASSATSMSARSCRRIWRRFLPSWRRRGEAGRGRAAGNCRAGPRGFQPAACYLGGPPVARRAPGSQSRCIDGGIALPDLPGPVDRPQRCRAGRRHAPSGAHPDRLRSVARTSAALAGRALRQLGELRAASGAGNLALVAGAAAAAGAGHLAGAGAAETETAVTGVLVLLVLGAFALVGLRLLGLGGSVLTMAAATLLFGGAGYVSQGRPGLAGAAPTTSAESRHLPVANARHAMFGQFTRSERWLIIADSFAARGKT